MPQILPQQLYQISSGDERAFRRMIHLFGDRLFQFAFSMVKNREDAEEIISDVCLKKSDYQTALFNIFLQDQPFSHGTEWEISLAGMGLHLLHGTLNK